ncbi:MAG: hypothetical protein J6T12_03690, partial [Salinivirgaceae bacterium]|nr:hypothetical protein [Salinivirgaceae bacterium]
DFKHSEVLELAVDEYGNYLVATFRGEKASFVYLYIYNLYTWDEKYKIKLNDNRCELYNSFFDEDGQYFYVNYDVFRNKFKKINLETSEIEEVPCSATPKGCRKLEQQLYRVDAYTVGDMYFIFRDDKYRNFIKIFVKKELYVPKDQEEKTDPETGGLIMLTPQDLRDLEAGQEIVKGDIPLFYDPNSLDSAGNVKPYERDEFSIYKIRLTPIDLGKLKKKISFAYGKIVIKLDLDAFEEEAKNK